MGNGLKLLVTSRTTNNSASPQVRNSADSQNSGDVEDAELRLDAEGAAGAKE